MDEWAVWSEVRIRCSRCFLIVEGTDVFPLFLKGRVVLRDLACRKKTFRSPFLGTCHTKTYPSLAATLPAPASVSASRQQHSTLPPLSDLDLHFHSQLAGAESSSAAVARHCDALGGGQGPKMVLPRYTTSKPQTPRSLGNCWSWERHCCFQKCCAEVWRMEPQASRT